MNATTATVLVAVISMLGSVVTALFGWLARKGADYVDRKTKVLDDEAERARRDSVKNRIVDVVTLVARATMQTYVDAIRAGNADGKLTPDEAREAFRRTTEKATAILKNEGIEVAQEILEVVVEAVVAKIKAERAATVEKAA